MAAIMSLDVSTKAQYGAPQTVTVSSTLALKQGTYSLSDLAGFHPAVDTWLKDHGALAPLQITVAPTALPIAPHLPAVLPAAQGSVYAVALSAALVITYFAAQATGGQLAQIGLASPHLTALTCLGMLMAVNRSGLLKYNPPQAPEVVTMALATPSPQGLKGATLKAGLPLVPYALASLQMQGLKVGADGGVDVQASLHVAGFTFSAAALSAFASTYGHVMPPLRPNLTAGLQAGSTAFVDLDTSANAVTLAASLDAQVSLPQTSSHLPQVLALKAQAQSADLFAPGALLQMGAEFASEEPEAALAHFGANAASLPPQWATLMADPLLISGSYAIAVGDFMKVVRDQWATLA